MVRPPCLFNRSYSESASYVATTISRRLASTHCSSYSARGCSSDHVIIAVTNRENKTRQKE
ncbi:hypothetical protein CPT_Moby_001 [Stenotrophomonas phage Moby]|uniref:Uncharacterized protein n=1 Tax=Stenotrophomonas phage Moby TaxID=2601680 RepID=A0A5P8PM56_9CAUD|nr:hypothetical protein HWC58_gp001 [Stenotrophomonas phage Moby]QFR57749.1 hypothetical protein CPT_Moby_001 [Stenotrophomonas phage Moby]